MRTFEETQTAEDIYATTHTPQPIRHKQYARKPTQSIQRRKTAHSPREMTETGLPLDMEEKHIAHFKEIQKERKLINIIQRANTENEQKHLQERSRTQCDNLESLSEKAKRTIAKVKEEGPKAIEVLRIKRRLQIVAGVHSGDDDESTRKVARLRRRARLQIEMREMRRNIQRQYVSVHEVFEKSETSGEQKGEWVGVERVLVIRGPKRVEKD